MVASSSSVGGSGTLQCGIKTLGLQYWASMGQGNQLAKAELISVEHRLTGKILKNYKYGIYQKKLKNSNI